MSNENTPFKNMNNNGQSKNSSKSPLNRTSNHQATFDNDRSISFLKSSEKKMSTGFAICGQRAAGYNTDDLIRDSESEMEEMNQQVSTII